MHILQRILPYLIGVLTLLMLSYIVSGPEHEGKVITGSDTISSIAKRKQIKDFEKETGSPSHWNPAQFGGSPAYLLKFGRENSVLNFFDSGLRKALSQVWYHFFITGLFMYIALCLLRINPWVSLALASAAMLTTNVYILLVTGHFAKVATLAPLPMLVAGIIAAFRKDYIAGFTGTFLGLAFAILLLHPQMVYYTVLGLTLTGLVFLVKTGIDKEWPHLGKVVGILLFAGLLSGLANYSHLKSSQDFAKSTMRGGSILESTSENSNATSKGLAWNYAMSWSYGTLDVFNLIIPRVVGGSSQEAILIESSAYKSWSNDYPEIAQSLQINRANEAQKNPSIDPKVIELPTYWGPMNMSTAGPMYFGAGLWILLVFSIVLAIRFRGRFGMEVLALCLGAFVVLLFALGSNAEGFNKFFFNNMPLFDKWRSPSAALAIVAMIFTVVSGLGIQYFLDMEDRKIVKPVLIRSSIIGSGILVLFAVLGSEFFKFTTDMPGASEAGYNAPLFVDLRKVLMTSDAWRSFMVTIPVLGMLALLIFQPKRKALTYAFAAVVGLVMVFDLLDIGSRYLSEYNYLEEEALYAQLEPNRNDKAIYAIEGEDNQGFYRVLDLSTNTFNDAIPSAKHYQIGGYDPAKLRRIQDVIESRALFSPEVLGMFNVRHVVQQDGQLLSFAKDAGFRQFVSEPKPVWFVNNIRTVSSPEEEIKALTEASFRHLNTAILNTTDFGNSLTSGSDTAGHIDLIEAEPDRLVYKSSSPENEFAVFSEVWYGGNPDWTVTVDGKQADFVRVNYILRGMQVPAGDHTIVFEYKPSPQGGMITLGASLLGLLLVLGGGGWVFYQNIRENKEEVS